LKGFNRRINLTTIGITLLLSLKDRIQIVHIFIPIGNPWVHWLDQIAMLNPKPTIRVQKLCCKSHHWAPKPKNPRQRGLSRFSRIFIAPASWFQIGALKL
jgi:hypothetical protein